MEGAQNVITLLEFKNDEDQEGFVLNSEAESFFRVDPDAYDMQAIATIWIIGSKHTQNQKLIKNIFGKVNFPAVTDWTRIQVWPTPVDVMDKHGTNIKAYVMNCQWDSEDEDVRNSFIALWMLFSTYTIVNIQGEANSGSQKELKRINTLIEMLKANNWFETEHELIEALPSLIWISREPENDTDEGPTWTTLDSLLKSEFSTSSKNSLTTLSYIQSKDYCCLPDHSSSTPFCEGIQDIRRKVINSVNPLKLSDYLLNQRMYYEMMSILVNYVNLGSLPLYHNMFLAIVEKELGLIIDEAKNIFDVEFDQKIEHDTDEMEVDELYQQATNQILLHFKRQIDAYLEVGDEVKDVLDYCTKRYRQIKEDTKRINDNLNYSESLDESGIMAAENVDNSSERLPTDDDEFNINMLDSTHNQPPPEERTPEKIINNTKAPTRSQILNEKVKELTQQLQVKDEKIKQLSSVTPPSPKSHCSSDSKDYIKLKQRLKITESELATKSSLFEQELKFYNKKIADANQEIEKLKEANNDQREKYFAKYDKEVVSLEEKIDRSNERILELEDELSSKSRELEKQNDVSQSIKDEYNAKLKNKDYKIQELEHRVETLLKAQKDQLTKENNRSDNVIDDLYKQISDLEIELKSIKRANNDKVQQAVNEKLIVEQRVTFLEQEKEDLHNKLTERIENEKSMFELIKKRSEDELEDLKTEFKNTIESKNTEISDLKDNITKLKEYYSEEIKNNKNDKQEISSEYTNRLKDFEKLINSKNTEIQQLQQNLEEIQSKDRETKNREFEELSQINEALRDRVNQLENDITTANQMKKSETYKLSSEAHDKINQIKEAYEEEKRKMHKKLKEIKDNNNEFEDKIAQLTSEHEEEVGSLHDQINEILGDREKILNEMRKQLDSESQKARSLESELNELKNKHLQAQTKHSEEMEQWKSKYDEIIMNLYNKMGEQMEIRDAGKGELDKENALLKQEKEYLEDKIKELEQSLCDITEEYESRITTMKSKIKDLKMQKFRDESRDKENENRFNGAYISPEDKLEDLLNLKITTIPNFWFIRVRSIEPAKPISSQQEKWEALKFFKDYDVYEIEVTDDDMQSHYVIERTSHQILGLFKRLKNNFKSHKQLNPDYSFPENFKELLFERQYCSKDIRQVTIQHYLNEVCKQDVFKKSHELAAFLEIARFRTDIQVKNVLKANQNHNLSNDYDNYE